MTKRVFLVHGWGGSPETDFLAWLKGELKNKVFIVEAPEMPDTENPNIASWVSHLSKLVGKPDKDTYFIGHSIGCQAIMRYVQNTNIKVGGLLFVAGWFNLANLEGDEIKIAEPWLNNPIDYNKVKQNSNKIIALLSDNDPFDCVEENAKIFKKKLGADVKILHNLGHFNSPKYEFILEEFLNLAR